MSAIALASRWTQPPPLGTPIDPKWIDRGLQFVWGPNTTFYIAEPWRSATQTFIGTNIGAVANEGGWTTNLNGNNQINIAGTIVGASPTEFSMIAACKPASVATDMILLSVSNGSNLVMLQQRVSSSAGYMLYSRSSVGDVIISPNVAPTLGPLRTAGGVWRSGTGEKSTFLNGVKTASVTTDTGTLAVTKASVAGDARSSGQCYSGALPIGMIFNRALSDAEMRSLTENPWQIFKPLTRRMWMFDVNAGSTTNVNPGAGALSLSGYAPQVGQSLNVAIAPGAGTLAFTGYAPAVTRSASTNVQPSAGTLALSGYAPGIAQTQNRSVAPGVGSLALTGYAPAVVRTSSQAAQPGVGALTLTGYAPLITQAPNNAPQLYAVTIMRISTTNKQTDLGSVLNKTAAISSTSPNAVTILSTASENHTAELGPATLNRTVIFP
jgi:hypothetical protein